MPKSPLGKKLLYTLEKGYLIFLKQCRLISGQEKMSRYRYLKMVKYGPENPENILFPNTAKDVDWKSNRPIEIHRKRAALFASFSKNGTVDDALLYYLSKLKTEVDFIYFVADNPLMPGELEKLMPLVEICLCRHHGEYDFGSWKRALEIFENSGKQNLIDELVFCNDSIIGPVRPLKELFDRFSGNNFYGITVNRQGFIIGENSVIMTNSPHVQSYFFVVSKHIFNCEKFKEFFHNVKRRKYKFQIIADFELGLTDLIGALGSKPTAWWIPEEDNFKEPTFSFWEELLLQGFFVKKSIARLKSERQINAILEKLNSPFRVRKKNFLYLTSEQKISEKNNTQNFH